MVKIFLIVWSLLQGAASIFTLTHAESAIHEIMALILALSSNISFCTACVLEYIQKAPLWHDRYIEKQERIAARHAQRNARLNAQATPPLGVPITKPPTETQPRA